jgi:hypothetical protein
VLVWQVSPPPIPVENNRNIEEPSKEFREVLWALLNPTPINMADV